MVKEDNYKVKKTWISIHFLDIYFRNSTEFGSSIMLLSVSYTTEILSEQGILSSAAVLPSPALSNAVFKLSSEARSLLPLLSPGSHCNHSSSIALNQVRGAPIK